MPVLFVTVGFGALVFIHTDFLTQSPLTNQGTCVDTPSYLYQVVVGEFLEHWESVLGVVDLEPVLMREGRAH